MQRPFINSKGVRVKRTTSHKKQKDPLLKLRLEFPGQAHWQGWLSLAPIKITTDGSGVYANTVPLAVDSIPNFFARFAAFQEARVVGARSKLLLFSSTQPGVLTHWFESGDDISTPTYANSRNQLVKRINNSQINGSFLSYVPHDPEELDWKQMLLASGTVAGNYNIYTDGTNYGSSTDTTLGTIQLDLHVQLRGLV